MKEHDGQWGSGQYLSAPGQAAFKDSKGVFFGYLINVILVFLLDVFILHPIATPAGTFSLNNRELSSLVLSDSNTEYASAKSISTYNLEGEKQIFICEKDGEVHALLFDYAVPLFRSKLEADVVIDRDFSGELKLGSGLSTVTVAISDGCRIDYAMLLIQNLTMVTYICYVVIGVALGIMESLIYHRFIARKVDNE